MTESIIAAIITGGMTLLGVLAANNKQQALTSAKLEDLTREVREHNNFAQRVPLLEQRADIMEKHLAELQSLHERQ